MSVHLQALETPRDDEKLVTFLCSDEWPFHGRKRLTPDDVAAMDFDDKQRFDTSIYGRLRTDPSP